MRRKSSPRRSVDTSLHKGPLNPKESRDRINEMIKHIELVIEKRLAQLEAEEESAIEKCRAEALTYREGNLVSGKLEALVEHMVPTADYYPDRAFLFAFLLTSRLFVKPHELLGQIAARCQEDMLNSSKGDEPSSHLVRLVAEWSETFPYDFRDERVMSHVRQIAHRCVSAEEGAGAQEVREEVSLILHNLLNKLTRLEQYEAFLHSIRKDSITSNPEMLSQMEVQELCGTASNLAQQLTNIELERLSYIGPEEFVLAYTHNSLGIDSTFKDPRITSNLEVYQDWTNRLCRLVVTDVVRQKKNKKQRVRVLEFWVETAKACFNVGNFNSLMAIITGLSKLSVCRLKRTWEKMELFEKYKVLEKQMSKEDDYSSYRSLLRAASARFNKDDPKLSVVIPVFAILAADLYALCDHCLIKLSNGHVNFENFWQLAKRVTEFITWKQVHCPFPKSAKIITYLQATPVLSEDASLLASFECEQPETSEEKELQKRLLA
ncbi:ras-GEF domain-containing family member 1B-like isoform X2 [Cimex lectularius]|uniref:Ras-GEF domain-containing family member 1B n=1 Tax=Cimex lectularius TaxID=79782 RepID=A0A8I6SBY1_CIMLE|nr:ras-GEF domain-containing family member 1B-like isoform X2 [Cimex lectularius]